MAPRKLQLYIILISRDAKNTHKHDNYLVGSLDSCGVAFVDGMQQLQLLQCQQATTSLWQLQYLEMTIIVITILSLYNFHDQIYHCNYDIIGYDEQ